MTACPAFAGRLVRRGADTGNPILNRILRLETPIHKPGLFMF